MKFSNIYNNKYFKVLLQCFICVLGVSLIGFAIAFNVSASLGNDPLSVFFDGVRNAIYNLTGYDNLGLSTNIVNYTLLFVILIIARKYINIGTFIYTLPLGSFVQLGFKIYNLFGMPSNKIFFQILTSCLGCFMLFLGLAIFISVDIGLDPWTALVMFISTKTNKQFKVIKILIDIVSMAVGFILGGKLWIVTVVAAFIGGPSIQYLSECINRILVKLNLKNIES